MSSVLKIKDSWKVIALFLATVITLHSVFNAMNHLTNAENSLHFVRKKLWNKFRRNIRSTAKFLRLSAVVKRVDSVIDMLYSCAQCDSCA